MGRYWINGVEVSREEYDKQNSTSPIPSVSRSSDTDNHRRRSGRRLAKRQSSLVNNLFKGTALLAVLVLFLNFWSPEGEVQDFDTTRVDSYHSINTTQAAMINNFISYAETRVDGRTKKTEVDLSGVYVDAMGVVPDFSSTAKVEAGDATVFLNSPTHALTDAAYVVNLEKLLEWEITDIMYGEVEVLGVSHEQTAAEYAREKLSSISIFGRENGSVTSYFGGAVGPAMLRRDWIAGSGWLVRNNTNASYAYAAFNAGSERHLDIMFVKQDDVSSYYAGDAVDVYYVDWRVGDFKAHTAPWGLTQTYIHFAEYGKYGPIVNINNDFLYTFSVDRVESTSDAYATMLNKQLSVSASAYAWHYLPSQSVTQLNARAYAYFSMFEYWDNQYWADFKSWYEKQDGLVCVGVVVFADNDLTPPESTE